MAASSPIEARHAAGAAHGAPCANCGAILQGRWCHACGQRDDDHHRSLRHLAIEAAESLTHADGRLLTTLRRLALHPGRLTRDFSTAGARRRCRRCGCS